jgi:drug/metabolite transporter (DMT)-like permease
VAVFIGLLVAACFGSGDFLGGLGSRRVATISILALAQLVAVAGAIVFALLFHGEPTGRDLALGAAAGALSVVALGALYQGLALGRMGIVAPITAVVAACIPVVWGLATGESPGAVALVGVACAVGAGGLIAHEHDTATGGSGRALVLALVAGVLFGWSFVLYAESKDDSGFWPVLTGRGAAVIVVLGALVATRATLRVSPPERWMAIGAGALDVGATVLLLVAVREDLASLVAPVAALGPAFTVGWAWTALREPIARLQVAGLALALVGLVLIAAG